MKKKQFIPLSVTIELTDCCNFNCPFCYIHQNNNKSTNFRRIDEYIPILDYLIRRGLLFCTLTGGEALLHPDFLEIYKYLKTNGVLITILTNGSLIDNRHIEVFKKYKPYKIEISLYGEDNNKFQLATNQKSYNIVRIKKNIKDLIKNEINVVCKTPLNLFTQDSFFTLKRWCDNNKIDYYYSSELFDSYNGETNDKYCVTDDKIIDLLHNDELNLYNQINFNYNCKKHFDCKAGKYSFVISYDWKLIPCFLFRKIEKGIFDINNNFEQAYFNFNKFITKYKDKKIEYCNGCKLYNFCTECSVSAFQHNNCDKCKKLAKKFDKIMEEINEKV